MKASDYISIDPEIMSGTPCFKGTRVPVSVLFVNLAAGISLSRILDEYPSIPLEAAKALLSMCTDRLVREVTADEGLVAA